MLIQVHMLQNFVPANMNRGEWGEPKSTMFGGHRRGRISSQCWKRAIRDSEYFTQEFEKHLLGIRTVELPYQIGHALAEMNVSDEIVKKIVAKVPEIGRKAKEEEEAKEENGRSVPNAVSKLANAKSRHSRPNPSSKSARSGRSSPKASPNNSAHPETGQLIYFAVNEVRDLAKQMNALYQQVGDQGWSHVHLEKTLVAVSPEAVDIALFGRWVTSNAFSRVEASVQVAHAISTHAQSREFDYYTALDDLSRQAGMLGEIEHNSSLYYRYFNVHWEQLRGNLKENTALARRVLAAFLKAAICAVPHGMSNQYREFQSAGLGTYRNRGGQSRAELCECLLKSG